MIFNRSPARKMSYFTRVPTSLGGTLLRWSMPNATDLTHMRSIGVTHVLICCAEHECPAGRFEFCRQLGFLIFVSVSFSLQNARIQKLLFFSFHRLCAASKSFTAIWKISASPRTTMRRAPLTKPRKRWQTEALFSHIVSPAAVALALCWPALLV